MKLYITVVTAMKPEGEQTTFHAKAVIKLTDDPHGLQMEALREMEAAHPDCKCGVGDVAQVGDDSILMAASHIAAHYIQQKAQVI